MRKKDLQQLCRDKGVSDIGTVVELKRRVAAHDASTTIQTHANMGAVNVVLASTGIGTAVGVGGDGNANPAATYPTSVVIGTSSRVGGDGNANPAATYPISGGVARNYRTSETSASCQLTPTVLALPVFANVEEDGLSSVVAMGVYLSDVNHPGAIFAAVETRGGRPQVSGIANVLDDAINEATTGYLAKIDRPELYEPWHRYLIQPTSL